MASRKPSQIIEEIFDNIQKNREMNFSALQRKLQTNYNSIKEYVKLIQMVQEKPKITVQNMKIKLIEDEIDPFIRQMVGYTPDVESLLFVKLLEKKAISPEKAFPISKLDKIEIELLNDLIQKEQIKITDQMAVYLTEMGRTVAEGAKRLYCIR